MFREGAPHEVKEGWSGQAVTPSCLRCRRSRPPRRAVQSGRRSARATRRWHRRRAARNRCRPRGLIPGSPGPTTAAAGHRSGDRRSIHTVTRTSGESRSSPAGHASGRGRRRADRGYCAPSEHHVKIALVYPPTCDPTAPYLAVPTLTGFLRANGVEVLPVDANVEAYDALLRRAPMEALRERIERRVARLEERASLDHGEQLEYLALWQARGDAHAVPEGIDEAVADPARSRPVLRRRAVRARRRHDRRGAARDLGGPRPVAARLHGLPDAVRLHDARGDRARRHARARSVRRLRRERARAAAARRGRPGRRALAVLPRAAAARLRVRPQAAARAAGRAPHDRRARHHAAAHPPSGARARGGARAVRHGRRLRGRAHAAGALSRARRARRARRCRARAPRHPERRAPRSHAGREVHARRGQRGHARASRRPTSTACRSTSTSRRVLTLPYDPTRGCYWGKCTFCHYGLAEVGTASYRERAVETCVEHLAALSAQARDAALLFVAGLGRAEDDRQAGAARSPTPASTCAGPPTSSPRST